MRLLLNKKGMFNIKTEEALLLLVIPIIFLSLVLVAFLVIPSSYFKLNTEEVNHFIIRDNILYSKGCLAYEDGRIHPGIVDINKFNPDRLQKCLGLKENSYGVILGLEYGDEDMGIEVNEQMTDRVNFCLSGGDFKCTYEEIYVLVNEDGGNKPGLLKINIVGFKE